MGYILLNGVIQFKGILPRTENQMEKKVENKIKHLALLRATRGFI